MTDQNYHQIKVTYNKGPTGSGFYMIRAKLKTYRLDILSRYMYMNNTETMVISYNNCFCIIHVSTQYMCTYINTIPLGHVHLRLYPHKPLPQQLVYTVSGIYIHQLIMFYYICVYHHILTLVGQSSLVATCTHPEESLCTQHPDSIASISLSSSMDSSISTHTRTIICTQQYQCIL